MNIEMRPKTANFADIKVRSVFLDATESGETRNVFMKITPLGTSMGDLNALELTTGDLVIFGGKNIVIPCPDATLYVR